VPPLPGCAFVRTATGLRHEKPPMRVTPLVRRCNTAFSEVMRSRSIRVTELQRDRTQNAIPAATALTTAHQCGSTALPIQMHCQIVQGITEVALRRQSPGNRVCTAKDPAEQGNSSGPDSLQNAAASRSAPRGVERSEPWMRTLKSNRVRLRALRRGRRYNRSDKSYSTFARIIMRVNRFGDCTPGRFCF
jgi:hypothetical protein